MDDKLDDGDEVVEVRRLRRFDIRTGQVVTSIGKATLRGIAECEVFCAHHRPVRLSWAKLLKRVFDLDLER